MVEEGRFEILTGGWVMTDEASTDLFGMVDQLIEGDELFLNRFRISVQALVTKLLYCDIKTLPSQKFHRRSTTMHEEALV